MVTISAAFDGGNIETVRLDSLDNLEVNIRKDHQSDFFQWFYFRLSGARNQPCTIRILNAHASAYPGGWKNYRAVASVDREQWIRIDTTYDGQALTLRLTPTADAVYLAYFAPYSMERHADLVARCLRSPRARLEVLGATLDGQDIDCLTVTGARTTEKTAWVIGRQHPGETMAEWWMEGFLDRLLDPHDPVARRVLEQVTLHIVPNMNPDGSRRGHLRTNAVGTNLNRAWETPSLEASPEVYLVRQRMEQTGVDFCLDVHGDEELPYNFLMGSAGIEGYTDHQRQLFDRFCQALLTASPDFQTEKGYPVPQPGRANLTMCTPWVAKRFGCLSMTLEQPFIDNANLPDETYGWSPQRCRLLGRAHLDALAQVVGQLR